MRNTYQPLPLVLEMAAQESHTVLFQVLSMALQAADLICPEPAIAIPVEGIPAGAPA